MTSPDSLFSVFVAVLSFRSVVHCGVQGVHDIAELRDVKIRRVTLFAVIYTRILYFYPPTHNREPYDTLLYCSTSCPYRSEEEEEYHQHFSSYPGDPLP